MTNTVNSFGLKRYIPSKIKRKIRSDAGYGCVICGNLFVDYEHIAPEFHEATEHDADKMTLLCSFCHDKVTKKIFSKDKVWKAKENPKAKQQGFVRDILDPNNTSQTVHLGSSTLSMQQVILVLHNKPVLWFSKSEDPSAPYELNFIFHDQNSNVAGFINKNIFSGLLIENDISTKGCTIKVKKGRKTYVEIKSEGGAPLKINKMDSQYGLAKISIAPNGDLILGSNIISGFHSSENDVAGIVFHGVPVTPVTRMRKKINKHVIAVKLGMKKDNVIVNYRGLDIAWVLDNIIITRDYMIAAYIGENEEDVVTSIVGESSGDIIGKLVRTKINDVKKGWMVVVQDDEHKNGEPIWISPRDKCSINARVFEGYDVSYRITTDFPNH